MNFNEPKIRVPFFIPSLGEEEIASVCECLSNGWITSGRVTRDFERQFAKEIGGDVETVAVNSATAGLHLSLEALGITQGDEVILPVNTFTATAEVICYLGAKPVFADIDYRTMNIDPDQIEAKITDNTKAVIPVHIAGHPADMKRIFDLARRHNLFVVEDAAHALPSVHDGRTIGALDSDACVFSFYATKTITTGEGGMIATRNKDLADRCRVMRLHGIDRNAFERRYNATNSWQYDVVAPGYKYNLTDLASSIGIQKLKKSQKFAGQRADCVALYKKLLKDAPVDLPEDPGPGDETSWHLFIIRLKQDDRAFRDELIKRMSDDGVVCSVHFIPLHIMAHWKKTLELRSDQFPVAEKNFDNCISLPLFPNMTPEQIETVASALKRNLASMRG